MFDAYDDTIEAGQVGDVRWRVVPDPDPYHPFADATPAGHLLTAHRRYDFGGERWQVWLPYDAGRNPEMYTGWGDIESRLARRYNAEVLPVYLYDHSVQYLSTQSFLGRAVHAEWDSGQVGVIFMTRDDIAREFGTKRVEKLHRHRARKLMEAEVATLSEYVSGEVYGIVIERQDADGDWEQVDSLWGIYGAEEARSEAEAMARAEAGAVAA